MPEQPPSDTGTPTTGVELVPVTAPVLASAELFGGRAEVRIAHDGVTYRLRKTANGKLILTK